MAVQKPMSDDRTILLHGGVNEETIAQVIAGLAHLAGINNEEIRLVISTYGGSVHEMFALYDMIKYIKCPVRTIALGKVMSAGVLLLASGEKGSRVAGSTTRIMMHSISNLMYGNIFEIENTYEEMVTMQKMMVKCLSEETKMTKKEIKEIMERGKDYYLTPKKAIKLGIIDRIMGSTEE